MILDTIIKKASYSLKNNNIQTHDLDAELILANIMKVKREFLIVNNKSTISKEVIKKYYKAINRRIKKEPVAYILGKKEFWSENFIVNHQTLIPRPETELLIYKIKSFFKNKAINVLDIGTGSGCILLSILKELTLSRGVGIDISPNAIKIAQKNARKLNLFKRTKFKVVNDKMFMLGKYDLVVSNPPYIPTSQIKNLSRDIRDYEPLKALDGGVDGLDLVKKVIYKSNSLLKRDGLLALEIGHNQYKETSRLLKVNGYREISKEFDFKRNVRCIISTKVNFY